MDESTHPKSFSHSVKYGVPVLIAVVVGLFLLIKYGPWKKPKTEEIEKEIIQAIRNNPQAVADYKAGKKQSLKFLVGQVMRATGSRANPKLVNELLEKKLEEG